MKDATKYRDLAFTVGDYFAGALIGSITAISVRAAVRPELDLVLAMLIGMTVGTLVHLGIGALLTPILGMFHVMVPAGLIGMFGGMVFAMRDSMQPVTLGHATIVGLLFGIVIAAGVRHLDHALAETSRRDS
ncbi:MAG: hypothetical protein M3132_01405 [Actinomycetia bacterium]|nr:hypothetical protein [Actinomycetes bacterium]